MPMVGILKMYIHLRVSTMSNIAGNNLSNNDRQGLHSIFRFVKDKRIVDLPWNQILQVVYRDVVSGSCQSKLRNNYFWSVKQ